MKAELERSQKEHKRWNNELQKILKIPQAKLAAIDRTNLPPDMPGAYGVSEGKVANAAVQNWRRSRSTWTGCATRVPQVSDRASTLPDSRSGQWQADSPAGSAIPEPAHRAGDGQPRLAAPFRPGAGRHAVELRPAGRVARRTRNYSTGWPPRFIESGWSIKAMHRLIVQSETYRLASHHQ